jgi:hypothetical protein
MNLYERVRRTLAAELKASDSLHSMMRRSSRSLVMLGAVACARAAPTPLSAVHAADQAIYRAVLDSLFVPRNSNRVTQLVIVDSTSTYRLDGLGLEQVRALYRTPGIDSSAIRDYETRNLQPHSLKYLPTLGLRLPVVLATSDSLRVVAGEGLEKYWSRFYQRYPHSSGSITLSAIGYNIKGDAAILIVEQSCGGLCGSGSAVVVGRDDGRWHLIAIQNLWIS